MLTALFARHAADLATARPAVHPQDSMARQAEAEAFFSLLHLQDVLDEWMTAGWHTRPGRAGSAVRPRAGTPAPSPSCGPPASGAADGNPAATRADLGPGFGRWDCG